MAKAKTNQPVKAEKVRVISKTLSGNDYLISLQEGQGRVHTLYLSKEESSRMDLGDELKVTLEKVESN